MVRKIPMKTAYTFDDILLVPQESNLSRKEIEVETEFVRGVKMKSPFIVSPMMQMRSLALAIHVLESGGGFILDRFFPIEERKEFYRCLRKSKVDTSCFAAAIGVRNGLEDAEQLADAGIEIFAIDVAHGAREDVYDLIVSLKFYGMKVIGGNVVTSHAAYRQMESGVDAIRVGVGNGSICLTRIETGFGVPQYSALHSLYEDMLPIQKVPIISDGGIRHYGDVVKAIHAGADSVMLGRQFAACPESEGETVRIDGKLMKKYFGMASNTAADALGVERFLSEGVENSFIPVGESAKDLMEKLKRHLQVGMVYGGARTFEELRRVEAVVITQNGVRESGAHDIILGD